MKKSVSATIWSVLDRVWSQIVGFFIGIILARLLTPEDYGLVGISMVFIAFSNVFIEAGFSNALIRKLDRTNTDYSTAFHFNAVMGVVMYAVLYLGAPWIADYFDDKQLIPLTRLVSITVVLNSLCIVQNAILTAEFRIREQAIINIVVQIPSGLLAVYLAYIGWGIYALAVNTVLSSFIRTAMFWIVTKWWPSLEFSMESMRYLWGFGSKLIGANFLGTVFNEIYTILVGKFIGKNDLGLYSKGRSLSTQPETICNGVIQKVALPLLANAQNDKWLLREMYRELTKLVTCVMTLLSGILIVVAKPLILLLWGEVWEGSVIVFQMLLIASVIGYVQSLTLVLLQIVNQTGYTLKLEFVKKPVYLVVISLMLHYGLFGLLVAYVINSLWGTVVNMSAPHKFIGYSYWAQIKDIAWYFIAWIVGALMVWAIFMVIEVNNVLSIIIMSIIVSLVYLGILWAIKDAIVVKYGKMACYSLRKP